MLEQDIFDLVPVGAQLDSPAQLNGVIGHKVLELVGALRTFLSLISGLNIFIDNAFEGNRSGFYFSCFVLRLDLVCFENTLFAYILRTFRG